MQPPNRNQQQLSRVAMINQQNANQVVNIGNQQILDHHDENLSDKEVYPGT